jgi:hypothetical protein
MILDAKRKILIAMFLEYQKDIYKMENVTPDSLEMDHRVFEVAVSKLQHEGYIEGAHITMIRGEVYGARIREALPTAYAIRYLENEFEIHEKDSKEEKSNKILKGILDAGMERAENIFAKIVAELIKG